MIGGSDRRRLQVCGWVTAVIGLSLLLLFFVLWGQETPDDESGYIPVYQRVIVLLAGLAAFLVAPALIGEGRRRPRQAPGRLSQRRRQ